MSTRLVSGFIIALGIAATSFAQQIPLQTADSAMAPGAARNGMLEAVVASEAVARKAEQQHLPDLQMARVYWHLGMSYEDAGDIGQSKAALKHSEALFRRSDTSGGELAETLDSLAVLDGVTDKLSLAVREETEALQLREKLGDRLLMARSWETMTALMLKQKKFDQARVFAQKGADELAGNKHATFNDKLAARYTLGMALCGQKDYAAAIPVLKQAAADARAVLAPQSIQVGIGDFLLGYTYWKSGDTTNAGTDMKTGINILNQQLSSGSPSYLPVLRVYAKYLHETRNVAEATEVNQRIQQAESVVSVGQLQSGPDVFGFAGFH